MASATATATMAAAGFDKKRASTASSLQTPGSGRFPSELLSPMASSPGILSRDELKTPITPPSAYLDFLKNMSPAMLSPAPTSTSGHFSFNKPSERASEVPSDKSSPPTSQPTTQLPQPQPPFSRHSSYDSNASSHSNNSVNSTTSHNTANSQQSSSRRRPESPRVIIPPSPFAKPAPRSAAQTPRLHIPQSPFAPSLGSAHTIPSPYTTTPVSAAPWSATFSPPADPNAENNGKPGRVSVRQVVTRTVTYCRTPLEPAPKGKRRKAEVEELDSESGSEEPPVKMEKLAEEVKAEPVDGQ